MQVIPKADQSFHMDQQLVVPHGFMVMSNYLGQRLLEKLIVALYGA
jgi:hypothetical protein